MESLRRSKILPFMLISILIMCLSLFPGNSNVNIANKIIIHREIKIETYKRYETVYFEYHNKGEIPIVFQKVSTTCGCVSVDYPQKPIRKNEKGKIKVSLDLIATKGHFSKPILIHTNTNETIMLRVYGNKITKT